MQFRSVRSLFSVQRNSTEIPVVAFQMYVEVWLRVSVVDLVKHSRNFFGSLCKDFLSGRRRILL